MDNERYADLRELALSDRSWEDGSRGAFPAFDSDETHEPIEPECSRCGRTEPHPDPSSCPYEAE